MKTKPPIHHEIRRLFGTLQDHMVKQIEDLEPSLDELEITSAYLAGLDDIMGKNHHPLTGKAAQIYDIVTSDEMLDEDEFRVA